jgi:DNA-binding response OmpR family regulator
MPEIIHSHILVVDDDPQIRELLTEYLTANELQVSVASSGKQMSQILANEAVDLVVLDVRLAGEDGMAIARSLREQSAIPIVMLTGVRDEADRVMGLELGADDYLTKPFEMMELLARVEALLRRARTMAANASDSYAFGPVHVDFRSAEVRREGAQIDLSTLEIKLLRYFVEHRGAVLARDELLDKVWGYDATPVTRTVDVHVASLRQKLEANPSKPEYIVTVHGLGYKFLG